MWTQAALFFVGGGGGGGGGGQVINLSHLQDTSHYDEIAR